MAKRKGNYSKNCIVRHNKSCAITTSFKGALGQLTVTRIQRTRMDGAMIVQGMRVMLKTLILSTMILGARIVKGRTVMGSRVGMKGRPLCMVVLV